VPAAALLILLLAAGPPTVAGPPEVEGSTPSDASTAAAPRRTIDGWRHAISVAWEGNTFWTTQDSHYTFHSVAVGYAMSTAASGVFLHLNLLFPLQARQDGTVLAVTDFYRNSLGLDALVGWEWRWELPHDLELEAGPGAHVALVALPGRTNYQSFSTVQVGVGGECTARWRPGATVLGSRLSLGAVVAPTLDLYDPLHASSFRLGLSLRAGVVVGLDLG
jgi:hypothetical protein